MSSLVLRDWVDVPCENREAAPKSRWVSACAVYKDSLYVFGGYDGRTKLNDLHEFSFTRELWRVLAATGRVPSAREGHCCVVYKDALYVFGGWDGRSNLNDLTEYNFLTQKWRVVVANGRSVPPPRRYHSAIVYDQSMYCFGGNIGGYSANDLHAFNFETQTWSLVDATGTVPPPRAYASLVVFENSAILFGGSGSSSFCNDVHVFDFDRRMWSSVGVDGTVPSPRYGHVAVIHSNAMYVFGGQLNRGKSNDLHKLTLGTEQNWTWQLVATKGKSPSPCSCSTAAVYDSSLVVFGGYGNGDNFSQIRFDEPQPSPDSSLLSYLRGLVNNELTSDITFLVEDAPIHAHRNLCMRCDYFKAMLTSEMVESRTREIVISDVRRAVFLSFLEYVYTDEVDVAVEDTMELLVVADRYGVDRLKRICESRVLGSLSVENAATLFHAADQYDAKMLREQCVSFILANFDTVSKTAAFAEMVRVHSDLVIELLQLR